MPCAISTGYTQDCNKDSVGGVRSLKAISKKDIVSYTVVAGIVTAIVKATGKQFYNFDLVKSTSNFTITPTPNVANGTIFYAEAFTFIMNKLKAATSAIVDSLAKTSLVFVVEDKNGEVFALGLENGMDLSGGTIGSGTATGDRSGYELQFTGEEKVISHVDPTILAGLLTPAV